MKKLLTLAAATVALWSNVSAQNLIQNPGAESFNASTFALNNWTIISGSWVAHDAPGYVDSVKAGTYMFIENGADQVGVLQQDIDVSSMAATIDAGTQKLLYTGWEQSYSQGTPSDQGITILQCMNAGKSLALYTWKSDSMMSTGMWSQFRKNFVVPTGTRYVRIQLISYRNQGSDNDGYFDALSLTPSTSAEGVETIVSNLGNISPNPAQQTLHVDLQKAGTYSTRIYASDGALVSHQSLAQSGNIDITALPAGVYFLSLTSTTDHLTQNLRFVKQ